MWHDKENKDQGNRKRGACILSKKLKKSGLSASPGPPSSDANLSSSHDELTILVSLIYEDTEELLEGLTAPDTGERRSAALESFNSNLDLFIERIEQVVASATSS